MRLPTSPSITASRTPGFMVAAVLALTMALPVGIRAEETLVINAASVSPASPEQWVLRGAAMVDGATGPEITIDATAPSGPVGPDLYLSFDGPEPVDTTGRWTVERIGPYQRSEAARFGAGAGSFRAPETKLVLQPSSRAVFTPDVPLGDLSLEFWLKPTRAESGEIVFLWKSTRKSGKTSAAQQISCIILRNRVVFGFLNFFGTIDGKKVDISLQGSSLLVPAVWSHHLVRFDSSTGLVEYLMNGQIEAVAYATSSGKQAGSVYTPIPGGSGRLELAQNYTGLLDEFRLTQSFTSDPSLSRYPAAGAVALSPIFDLGATNSELLSIAARVRTPGESALHWSYRIADSSVGWRDDAPAWIPFTPGSTLELSGAVPRGRYIQLRAELFPDATGERAPSVSSVSIVYEPDRAPAPPGNVSASPGNARLVVRWTPVSEADVAGYMVYYGLAPGDYFGSGAAEGASPIFVPGARTSSLTLNGLKNGSLYFVAVAAYDRANPPHIGELSREISARPSRVSP